MKTSKLLLLVICFLTVICQPIWAAPQGALVKMATDKTIQSSTPTVIDFETELYDNGGWHDDTLLQSRLTVPAGVTHIRACTNVVWGQNDFGHRNLKITKNGFAFDGGMYYTFDAAPALDFSGAHCTAKVPVVEGDYFEVNVTHWTPGTIDIKSFVETWFSIEDVSSPSSFNGVVYKLAGQTPVTTTSHGNLPLEIDKSVGSWESGSDNSHIIVPEGISKVKVCAHMAGSSTDPVSSTLPRLFILRLFKNGDFDFITFGGFLSTSKIHDISVDPNVPSWFVSIGPVCSAPLSVIEGDFFQVNGFVFGLQPVLTYSPVETWVSIEAIQ